VQGGAPLTGHRSTSGTYEALGPSAEKQIGSPSQLRDQDISRIPRGEQETLSIPNSPPPQDARLLEERFGGDKTVAAAGYFVQL
jgi:hypothetical protein